MMKRPGVCLSVCLYRYVLCFAGLAARGEDFGKVTVRVACQ